MACRDERRRTPLVEQIPPEAVQSKTGTAGDALRSWREIAAYVGKGVRTVQRWESLLAFPVHRRGKSMVVAYRSEIDAWARGDVSAPIQRETNTTGHTTPVDLDLNTARLREAAARNIAATMETFEKTKRIWAAILQNNGESRE